MGLLLGNTYWNTYRHPEPDMEAQGGTHASVLCHVRPLRTSMDGSAPGKVRTGKTVKLEVKLRDPIEKPRRSSARRASRLTSSG